MDFVTPLDDAILHLCGAASRRSESFDQAVAAIAGSNLAKGGVMAAVFWGVWGAAGDSSPPVENPERSDRAKVRRGLLATLIACFAATAGARTLAATLPFRTRPVYAEPAAFRPPFAADGAAVPDDWSSMPSDHAVLFCGLAAGLLLVHRRAGAFAAVWTGLVVLVPRLYLGLHYLTDLLAGAALGAAVVAAAVGLGERWAPARRGLDAALGISRRWPVYFSAALFLATYEMASLFGTGRRILKALASLLGV